MFLFMVQLILTYYQFEDFKIERQLLICIL